MTFIRRFFALALTASLISVASAQNSNLKIATVDMQELFNHFYKTNEAQDQIDLERAKLNQENINRMDHIKKIETDLENLKKQIEDPSVNESKKQSLILNFQLQQQEGMQLEKERREYIQRRTNAINDNMNERLKSILVDIRKLVIEKSKADNYDFVFDKSGTGVSQLPILLYSKDSTDITAALLKTLNKDAPPSEDKKDDEDKTPK